MKDCVTFEGIYEKQLAFQRKVSEIAPYDFQVDNLPEDNVKGCSYHIQQLVSEVGEILSSDKRWKNFRNGKYDENNKKEEIADCFIVLMNIAIFSGLSGEDLEKTILEKMDENAKRLLSLKNC